MKSLGIRPPEIPRNRGFMKVPVDGDLSELACDFVAARGSQFNEGRVVYKGL